MRTSHQLHRELTLVGAKLNFSRSKTTVDGRRRGMDITCSLCLCTYSVADERHQSCVCECYCHSEASESSLLHRAAQTGSVKILEHLLAMSSEIDSVDLYGNTALHLAARFGHTASANLLLQRRANPNKEDHNGNCPLHYAAKYGHVAVATLLQRHGADVNVTNMDMCTPLHYAVMAGKIFVVKNLLKNPKLDVNLKNCDGNTALLSAVMLYDATMCLLLMRDKRVDVNATNNIGQTALHIATECGRELLVRQFLKNGHIDANIYDCEGSTALHIAAKYGYLSVIHELLVYSTSPLPPSVNNTSIADLEARNPLGLTPLHLAIAGDYLASSDYLIRSGSDLNACDNDGNNCLHFAAAAGSLPICKELLSHGLGVNSYNRLGDTSLHIAAYFKHLKLAEYLLNMGANVNLCNNVESSPLHHAVEKDAEELALLFLRRGASINAKDANGRTPIHLAVASKNEALAVKLLTICKDFDLEAIDRKGDTLLHLTCKLGLLKVAKFILKLNPDLLFVQNVYGNSPLHYAAKYRQHKLTKLLLAEAEQRDKLEQFVNSQNIAGKTALHLSAKYGDIHSSKLLVANKGSVEITDDKGQTPLHMASICTDSQSSISVSHLLIESGADVGKLDKFGNTPLHEAAKSGNASMITFLVDHGANVDQPNASEHTPLHLAAAYGQDRSMSVLITQGADCQKATSKGNTSIHGTAASGNKQALALLVEKGISPHTKNQDGMSSLHVAAANDHDGIIEYLVEIGMDVTEQDNIGRTALHIAIAKGNQQAVDALIRHGADLHQVDNNGRSALDYAKLVGNINVGDFIAETESIDVEDQKVNEKNEALDEIQLEDDILLANPFLDTVASSGRSGADQPEEDELRSNCTEDDIADQLGLFVQPLATSGRDSHYGLRKALSSTQQAKAKKGQAEDESEANGKKSRHKENGRPTRRVKMKRGTEVDSLTLSEDTEDGEEAIETVISQLSPSCSLSDMTVSAGTVLPFLVQDTVSPERSLPYTPETVPQAFPNIQTAPAPGKVDLSRDYSKRKKMATNRRAGNLLSTQAAAPKIQNRERTPKGWIFDDEVDADGFNPTDIGQPEREMSFEIIPRSPTPRASPTGDEREADASGGDDLSPRELSSEDQAKRRWGKAKIDSRFRDELEKQRLAEERKKKAMKMKLARAQHKNTQQQQRADNSEDLGELSDEDWLARHCVFGKGMLEVYREVFNTLLGSTDEMPASSEKLSMAETVMALTSVNRELQVEERHYLIRICEILGCDIRRGCNFRSFSLIAALSHRITALDEFTRRLYRRMDTQSIEMNAHFCRRLWESCRDADTGLMSKEKLIIELKAGGVSKEHEDFVGRSLTASNKKLDFLDFLTYIPLFVLIHRSVVRNPFDNERCK